MYFLQLLILMSVGAKVFCLIDCSKFMLSLKKEVEKGEFTKLSMICSMALGNAIGKYIEIYLNSLSVSLATLVEKIYSISDLIANFLLFLVLFYFFNLFKPKRMDHWANAAGCLMTLLWYILF